ncbi:MAG: hypothetical protein AAGA48_16575 [Myxococcota bacterium]
MISILLSLGPAFGHVGDVIAGADIVVPPGEEAPLSVEATFGLAVGQPDGTFDWVCHEAVTEPTALLAPEYDQSDRGEWLASVSDLKQGRGGHTLFHSPDACAWNTVTGLPKGALVTEARFDPGNPDQAFAVTATPGPNGIYVSADGGRSWTEDLAPQSDTVFHGVRVVDGEVYTSGSNAAGTTGVVWHRDLKGTWTASAPLAFTGLEGVRLRLLGVTADAVYLNADPLGADVLYVADRALTSITKRFSDQGEILDLAVARDGLWLPMDFGNRALRLDGETLEERTLPPSIGAAINRDGELVLAELAYLSGPMLSTRTADGTFEPTGYPDDILGTLDCAADTEVAMICEPLWPQLEPRLRGFDDPYVEDSGGVIPPPPETGGCAGCATGQPGASWWLTPGLLLLAIRRRSRA